MPKARTLQLLGAVLVVALGSCKPSGETQRKPAPPASAPLPTITSTVPVQAKSTQPVLPPVSQPGADRAAALASRPWVVRKPSPSPPGKKPLILVLHGYGASSEIVNRYVPVGQLADAVGALLVTPNGTADSKGRRFWNATDACCNFEKSDVNDVQYLSHIIDDAIENHDADASRVYVMGYSNGGFMAHRMACELSGKVAAIASVSGSTFSDSGRCKPTRGVGILQIHGNADTSVRYEGGHTIGRTDFPAHPSARNTIQSWSILNQCTGEPKTRGKIDLEEKLAGAETTVEYYDGCKGGGVELWTVQDGGHSVGMKKAGLDAIWGFLKGHKR